MYFCGYVNVTKFRFLQVRANVSNLQLEYEDLIIEMI